MKLAIRRILVTLAWVGLLLGQTAFAQDWKNGRVTAEARAEVIPPGETTRPPLNDSAASEIDPSIIGEHQMPIGGVFGDTPPAACEFCGGGGCLPPAWSFDSSIAIIAETRANNRQLTTSSIPGGPFQITSGTNGQAAEYRFFNDAVQTSIMEIHTLVPDVSPAWNFKISHFLGRDGEKRDHFLEFEYTGLDKFQSKFVAHGSLVPIYSTATFTTDPTTTSPTITGFQGSLNSPFPFPSSAQPSDPTNSFAFNRALEQSAFYVSTLNEWELNYRFAGHNQPDQLVLNPNGHWYRQCQTGYFYSYLFGFHAMTLDESFEYLSQGATTGPNPNIPSLINSGRYMVRTTNTMLGMQTGGTLEYRFCRWTMELHGKAAMFLNMANQSSIIQTQLHGYLNNDPNSPVDSVSSNPFDANNTVVAFAGGFGVKGAYKFRPNLIGHVGYDMMWLGDVARAPEQMIFAARPQSEINTKGNAFFNGVTLGLEWDW